MSDVVDGRLARSSGQITEMGKFLDPVADKLMLASVMIPLSLQDRFPWWATCAILFRELGITLFRALVISGGVISANRGGKLKTLSQNWVWAGSSYRFRLGLIGLNMAGCMSQSRLPI